MNFTKPRGINSSHRIASYIAKYVSKAVSEASFNAKSYWQSRGIPRPNVEKHWHSIDTPTRDIIVDLAHAWIAKGYTDFTQYSDKLNEFYWFAASKPS